MAALVTDADVHEALAYLEKTSKPFAHANAKAKSGERLAKVIRARIAAEYASFEKSQAAADAQAEAHPKYQQAVNDWRAAMEEADEYWGLREVARYKIEVWRTLNANARQGKL